MYVETRQDSGSGGDVKSTHYGRRSRAANLTALAGNRFETQVIQGNVLCLGRVSITVPPGDKLPGLGLNGIDLFQDRLLQNFLAGRSRGEDQLLDTEKGTEIVVEVLLVQG